MNPPEYVASYQAIADDHLRHWRATGSNPFQPDDLVAEVLATTVAVLRQYAIGARVLDVGCGMGLILGETPEYERHGIDIIGDFVALARERGIDAVVGEVEALPYPDEHFDAVLATDLLEHVLDLNAAIRELLRVLRPGGVLIVRSPDCEDMGAYVDYRVYDYCHLRRFDEPSLRLLFERVFHCTTVAVSRVRSELIFVTRK